MEGGYSSDYKKEIKLFIPYQSTNYTCITSPLFKEVTYEVNKDLYPEWSIGYVRKNVNSFYIYTEDNEWVEGYNWIAMGYVSQSTLVNYK